MSPAQLGRILMQKNKFHALSLCSPKNFTSLAKGISHCNFSVQIFICNLYALSVWNTTFKSELLFATVCGITN